MKMLPLWAKRSLIGAEKYGSFEKLIVGPGKYFEFM
jgi:hypothetical protein